MTKSDLIVKLADRFPQLVAKDADFAVKMILDALSEALAKGDRIEIRGFGSFSVRWREARIARNLRTGEPVEVAAHYVPSFKPGRELREWVQDRAVIAANSPPPLARRPV